MDNKWDKNSANIKLIALIGDILSLISGILTILSFYGYKDTKRLTYIFIGSFWIIITVTLFKNKNKIFYIYLNI